jgi:single-stranded DNA-binding protein
MSEKNWLAELKKGDRVIVSGRYGSERYVQTVLRLTATRILVGTPSARIDGADAETAFRKSDGHEIGAHPYSGRALVEGTPEAVQAVSNENKRIKLADALAHRNWRNVSLEKLEQITAILTPPAL